MNPPSSTSTTDTTKQVLKHRKRLKNYARMLQWRQLHINDSGFVLLLSVIVGLLAGIAAWLLKFLINHITTLVAGNSSNIQFNFLYICLPVIGVTLSGLFCRYILRSNVANGVAKLVNSLNNKDYRLSGKTIYGSMIASSLTLGFGGTAGSEGPIAYTGAGIGSGLGRIFRVSPQMMAILIGCGAGAGIAAIFKAPVGGALFTLEVLRVEMSTVAVMGVFLATVTGALTAYALSGCTLDIDVISPGAFDYHEIYWVIGLGVICGLYSLYYTYSGSLEKRILKKCQSQWIKYLISGTTIGAMIFMFPAMYGEGYGVITQIINGNYDTMSNSGILSHLHASQWLVIIICCGILMLKGIGSSATNNGGGVAGDFAPTLFAGCILGLLFAITINYLHIGALSPAHYALIAMGGAMAGIIRAPLMAMFLTTEMIGGFEFLLPVAIVSLISYCIVMIIKRDTFYHSKAYTSPVSFN